MAVHFVVIQVFIHGIGANPKLENEPLPVVFDVGGVAYSVASRRNESSWIKIFFLCKIAFAITLAR